VIGELASRPTKEERALLGDSRLALLTAAAAALPQAPAPRNDSLIGLVESSVQQV
jgi:hypothetical protein